ncbi:DUF3376 domain-containing protein [Mycobacterium sp. MBM]|nr:DUF3376 domain-containing protein [Mycobacterium sp. MBM]
MDYFQSDAVRTTARALALAARASAGFPIAFEPTFIPVDDSSDHGRTDMAPFAEWRKAATADGQGSESTTISSRYGVDGGVLNNTPTLPALRGIQQRRAGRRFVRRVLVLVHPHAEDSATAKVAADKAESPPTLVATVGGILQAATSTGSRAYVREIEMHNEAAIRLRDSRALAMNTFTTWGDLGDFLSTPAWTLFRAMRMERNAVFMANAVYRPGRGSMPKLKAAALAFLRAQDSSQRGLPFLPNIPPGRAREPDGGWPWGIAMATGLTAHIVQMVREFGSRNDPTDGDEHERLAAVDVFSLVVNANIDIDRLGEQVESDARKAAAACDGGADAKFAAYLDEYRSQLKTARPEEKPTAGDQVRGLVWDCVVLFYTNVLAPYRRSQPVENPAVLGGTLLADCDGAEDLLVRLLSVEIVAYIVRENSVSGTTDDYVELVQLNARTPQDFAKGATADDKLAGMALARFSAFFKESWRANDWTWGRLDAVKTLMQVLLTAEAIGRVVTSGGVPTDEECDGVVDEIVEKAFPPGQYVDTKPLLLNRRPALFESAKEEVKQVLMGTRSGQLEHLPSLAAYGIQIATVVEEIPALQSAIAADSVRGALGARSARFVSELERLSEKRLGVAELAYEQLHLFQQAGIGRETMAEQVPSDALIRTVSTAVATTAGTLTSPRSGLKFAAPVTSVIRGVAAVPYWLINGLTHRGQLARIAAATALAVGTSLVAISLLVPLRGFLAGLVPVLGFGSLFALAIYGAMRTRSLVHVAALLGLFVPLLMLGLNRAEKAGVTGPADAPSSLDTPEMGWFAVLCTVAIVIGTVVIANLSTPVRSPLASTAALVRDHRVLTGFMTVALLLAVVVRARFWLELQTVWTRFFADHVDPVNQTVSHHLPGFPFNVWVYVVIGIAGLVLSVLLSWGFREPMPAPAVHGVQRRRLIHPTGLAIAWTSIYGAVYLVLTWVLAKELAGRSGIDALPIWVSLGLGVTFSLFVAPVLWIRWRFTSSRRLADGKR